ncbi:MAG: sodium:proton antiporter [Chthoniobacterales bacterium]|nr:sodium:proton antiporter [Chthoniobacterales bacterium]
METTLLLPFVLMLLSIVLMPFIHRVWWEVHFRKVSLVLAGITLGYYLFALRDLPRVSLFFKEYLSFIILIGSLFVVAGGIHLRVQGESTPLSNTLFLFIGSLVAIFIGTTGASMLLIRPWIHSNRYRVTAFHLVFFIFIVSNIGGCLSPIGDPPLFLGYLRGVPFFWLLQHLWSAWLLAIVLLLGIFYFLDRKNFLQAPKCIREMETMDEEWSLSGFFNFFFLMVIILAVFAPSPWREVTMILTALLSYFLTPQKIFEANKFSFHPIEEVAWLFFGIFATMIPLLELLEKKTALLGSYARLTPSQFYYLTGSLSAFLDNAPTYLTFMQLHLGTQGLSIESVTDVAFAATHEPQSLIAISLGAVCFGGMTYIGNGPNFMVKSIAEESNIRMPNFLNYMLYYSLPILAPVLLLVGWFYCR